MRVKGDAVWRNRGKQVKGRWSEVQALGDLVNDALAA